jgi:hypothetical protein
MRERVCAVIACATTLVLMAGGAAHADDVLDRAHQLLREFEYAEAAAMLQEYITGEPDVDAELSARQLLVQALVSAGELDSARTAAAALYERDPGYELSDPDRLSPRIRTIFAEARNEARNAPTVEAHVTIRESDEAIEIVVGASTPRALSSAQLSLREPGGDWREVTLERRGSSFSGSMPYARSFAYHARLLAPSGWVVAEKGSAEAPVSWRGVMTGVTQDAPQASPYAGGSSGDGSPLVTILVVAGAILAAGAVALLVWRPWEDGAPNTDGTLQLP